MSPSGRIIIALVFFFLIIQNILAQKSSGNELNPEIKESIKRGESLYNMHCKKCHKDDGKGIEEIYPPLAQSDFLLNDKYRAIRTAIFGSKEPIVVNDVEYDGELMPTIKLEDEDVRDVVNYILNSWENQGGTVTIKDVQKVRNE